MKRKIIKQGHSTLTVTIPNEWAKELSIKAGDEVDLSRYNGSIVINGHKNSDPKKTTINIAGFRVPMIWRLFQSAYREGYEEIKVVYDDKQKVMEGAYNYYTTQFEFSKMGEKIIKKPAIEMIQELVNRFIGVAIIDSRENHCIVREMGELTAKEFDNSLKRIFLLIIELFDEVLRLIKENKIGDITVCKTLYQMDINIDRFIDYCCRINNKIIDSSFQNNKPAMFSTLFLLELLGDEFKYIGTHLTKAKKNVSEILPFAERIRDHFQMYYDLFYKFDRNEAIKFGENDFQIYNDHVKRKETNNLETTAIKRHFMQISKFIFCLMELRVEMEFNQPHKTV